MRANWATEEIESAGEDSFLDIVANIVGILILLVMVVSVRAGQLPAAGDSAPKTRDETRPELPEQAARGNSEAEIAQLESDLRKQQSELQEITAQLQVVVAEQVYRDEERTQLQVMLDRADAEVEKTKSALDETSQQELELRSALAETQAKLDELAAEQLSLDMAEPETQQIEVLPTPLAQTVHGEELHFRLAGGRISRIPLTELLDTLQSEADSQLSRLQRSPQFVDSIGPINGYRLRYRLIKQPVLVGTSPAVVAKGEVIRMDRWELLPTTSESMGEPIEMAVAAGGEVIAALQNRPPGSVTITVWTYPDSFDDYRALKRYLFERGFSTAARPLPQGIRIGGSPNGTRSAAQ